MEGAIEGSPSHPDVYIGEAVSGMRTISGVATSIAAFVDFFPQGPIHRAVAVHNFTEFERVFGGLHALSEGSYQIQQFFLNGGRTALVSRVETPGALASTVEVAAEPAFGTPDPSSTGAISIQAIDPGAWGNRLRCRVDPGSAPGLFSFLVIFAPVNGAEKHREEHFQDMSIDKGHARFVEAVVNNPVSGSQLIRVHVRTIDTPPAVNGTLSGAIQPSGKDPANTVRLVANAEVQVTIGGETRDVALRFATSPNFDNPLRLVDVAAALQAGIRGAVPDDPAWAGATVEVEQSRLWLHTSGGASSLRVQIAEGRVSDVATKLRLVESAGAVVNVQQYELGDGAEADSAQVAGTRGVDGSIPDANDLIGSEDRKTGIHQLMDVDLFNILCIPRLSQRDERMTDADAALVMAAALRLCETKRAMLIVDVPPSVDTPAKVRLYIESVQRHKNAAIYFPRLEIPDPLNGSRQRNVGTSGTIAGLYARTDFTRGIWKAPAGVEATLQNISRLAHTLTDAENGGLNPLGINCLRTFSVYGNVCWGGRTLEGADAQASEWKYVSVRRTALFIEESLSRGLHWVVFEPNDEPLWSQIRLNVGAFMHSLFLNGAFAGSTPADAYFARCDRTTTTQSDVNLGVVNVWVGFAPLKPAEFVVIRLQQLAGQISS